MWEGDPVGQGLERPSPPPPPRPSQALAWPALPSHVCAEGSMPWSFISMFLISGLMTALLHRAAADGCVQTSMCLTRLGLGLCV